MSYGISLAGIAQIRARLDGMRERTADMSPGLLRAGLVAVKAAKEHIDSGGDPPWKQNRAGTPLLHKTGRLLNSLTIGSPDGVLNVSGNSIVVGTNVPYARYLQEGTDSHARGTPLVRAQGPRRYATGAMPARPFLYIDEKIAQTIHNVFSAYIFGKATDGA